ncbi:MAG: HyaD/HybD family hydrogenase maturation endopeptidase [Anaerolineae bacterium]
MKKTLILGLGNILLGDEGVGVRVVERLLDLYHFPEGTQVLDGGTLALDLLPYVEDADRMVVIDAVDMRAEPGTVVRITDEEVPTFLSVKVSPHQMGLADILSAARLRGLSPGELVLWGVQPEVMDTTLELSPPVAAQVDVLVDGVLADLSQWGIEPTGRGERG